MKVAITIFIFGITTAVIALLYRNKPDWIPLDVRVNQMSDTNNYLVHVSLTGRHELLLRVPLKNDNILPSQISTDMTLRWDREPTQVIKTLDSHSISGSNRYYFVAFLESKRAGEFDLEVSKPSEIDQRWPEARLEMNLFPEQLKHRLVVYRILRIVSACLFFIGIVISVIYFLRRFLYLEKFPSEQTD